jgi:hypothetical protein
MGSSQSLLSRFGHLFVTLQSYVYAVPTILVSIVGIILALRWRARMRQASTRVVVALTLQLIITLMGIVQNVYIRLVAFDRSLFVWVFPLLSAVYTALHTLMLGLLLWAVHGAYRARGDVERFI